VWCFRYPMKLHEYLATGRAVVVSPIRSLLEFSDAVRIAGTPEQWSQALTESLATDAMAPAWVEARHAVAREYEWHHLVRLIACTLCERLGPSYFERFRGLSAEKRDAMEAENGRNARLGVAYL
jgi:hypothetical protein